VFAFGVTAAVAQQKLAQAMPSAQEIDANVFPTPEQVADGFFIDGRDMDGGQRARAIEHGQLSGVATVRFDACAGPSRN
jgi:hypothetical protein